MHHVTCNPSSVLHFISTILYVKYISTLNMSLKCHFIVRNLLSNTLTYTDWMYHYVFQ